LAVVTEVEDVVTITTKNGETKKRTLTVVDASGASIKLSIWGPAAETFDGANFPVYAFKAVRISDFNGRSLSTNSTSGFYINPDIREAHELRAWYDTVGQTAHLKLLSVFGAGNGKGPSAPKKTFGQVRDEGFGMTENQNDDFFVRASILLIAVENKQIAYPGCPTEGCSKKVTEEGAGQWRCEKCDNVFPNCIYRYSLSFSLGDFTGQFWARGFDSVGQKILGQPADTMVAWRNDGDPNFTAAVGEATLQEFNFKIRAKLDKYEDNFKTSFQILGVYAIDFAKDSKFILEDIAKYYN
jgi:replication factor A1